jgi:hypothetical protein
MLLNDALKAERIKVIVTTVELLRSEQAAKLVDAAFKNGKTAGEACAILANCIARSFADVEGTITGGVR